MSATRQSSSFNSSVASSQLSNSEDMEAYKAVFNYAKELLKSRIFLGRYIERRLINQRVGYRDVVLISDAETELKKDLVDTLFKLHSTSKGQQWIGIADTDILGNNSPGVYLLTEIENQPFGPFWFQIKSLKSRDAEVLVTLKCLKHISDAYLEKENILGGTSKKVRADKKELESNSANLTLNETYTEVVGNLKNALSITNVKEFVTFLFAFVIAIFTGSTAFVNFLGTFILALIREMSILVKNSTPMFLGLLDFFSKIVGGFYILLAMFFKPNNPVPTNKRSVRYYEQHHQPTTYDDRQFD